MDAVGIKDGYTVIVRCQDTVDNGQIALVLINWEDATLKRFSQAGDIVTLMPQSTNPVRHPFVFDLKDTHVDILGLVVKVEFSPVRPLLKKEYGMDHSLSNLYQQLAALASKYGAQKLVLFGSRARGDNTPRSDIDLAVYGMPKNRQALFWSDADDLNTLLKLDIVHITPGLDQIFLDNIEKDGVVLMDRTLEKRDKLQMALTRLEESLAAYDETPTSVVRDGVIQRFEFCTELAWKSAREYLLDQGYTEINSPKAVMRQAYADDLIADQEGWLKLLEDRNLTSHLYSDATASEIFQRIRTSHLALFLKLSDRLNH